MKVLHLTSGNLFGGIETYLLTLARLRHLCPEMEPQFGVCFPGRLHDELTAAGVPVHDLGPVRVSRPWTVLRARRRLRKILLENPVDVIVTHGTWPHAVFAPAVRRAGVRLVNCVHGELGGRHWIDRWAALTSPDRIITNSRFTADTVQNVFPDSPTIIVYPPVTYSESLDRTTIRQRLRAEFATNRDAVVILAVSRIEELKGHAVLIDALGQIREMEGWACWVVGGPQRPHEHELLAQIRARAERVGVLDRIRFTGPRDDVPAVMAAADCYCQPNTGAEGFGLVFIEALYSGLPVVTSNFGGAREIVTEACGVLCPPNDSVAVAAALRELIFDTPHRHSLGKAGPARAVELCDPTRQLATLKAAIEPGGVSMIHRFCS